MTEQVTLLVQTIKRACEEYLTSLPQPSHAAPVKERSAKRRKSIPVEEEEEEEEEQEEEIGKLTVDEAKDALNDLCIFARKTGKAIREGYKDEIFFVDKVLKHKEDEDGEIRFYVSWQGYPDPKMRTWERAESFVSGEKWLTDYKKLIGIIAKGDEPKVVMEEDDDDEDWDGLNHSDDDDEDEDDDDEDDEDEDEEDVSPPNPYMEPLDTVNPRELRASAKSAKTFYKEVFGVKYSHVIKNSTFYSCWVKPTLENLTIGNGGSEACGKFRKMLMEELEENPHMRLTAKDEGEKKCDCCNTMKPITYRLETRTESLKIGRNCAMKIKAIMGVYKLINHICESTARVLPDSIAMKLSDNCHLQFHTKLDQTIKSFFPTQVVIEDDDEEDI
jgi:hypothetical protein